MQARLNAGVDYAVEYAVVSSKPELRGRSPNDMRLDCAICPRVGQNITVLEIRATPSVLRHVYRQHLTNDGNFQLNRYQKNNRDDSEGIWGGNGYSPENGELQRYLEEVNDYVEVSPSLLNVRSPVQIVERFRNPPVPIYRPSTSRIMESSRIKMYPVPSIISVTTVLFGRLWT